VLTSDCPVGHRKRRRRKVAAAVLAGGLMTAGLGGLLWSNGAPDTGSAGHVQGEMTIEAHDTSHYSGGVSFMPDPEVEPYAQEEADV